MKETSLKPIITAAAGIILGTCLLLSWGCSTARYDDGNQDWSVLFSPAPDSNGTWELPDYQPDRLQSDYATLKALTDELDALAQEMAALRRILTFNDRPHLTELQSKQIALQLFRFTAARGALLEIYDFYRTHVSPDPGTHVRGAILGMDAGLHYMYFSSRFAAMFYGEKRIIRLLDSAYPSYDIPAGTYTSVMDSTTSIDNLELMALAWYLFSKDLADPDSRVFRLYDADPVYRELIDRMDSLYASTQIQIGYVINARVSVLPEVYNRLSHSQIAKLGDSIGSELDEGITQTRGFVFRNVGRIKDPGTHVLEFSDEQVRQIREALQPGDLLFTYTSGYMSNVFLPGNFKHGITYVGTPEERRQAGLTDEVLLQRAVSPEQGQKLIEDVNTAKSGDYDIDVVEAVAEGVIMNSLEKLLDTHVNRLAVIRPRISDRERLDQLILLFQYIGAPYDFKFDFQDAAYQCCTELIYRTANRKGEINFSLDKLRGLWILDADRILRYYLEQNPEAFEFILFADQSSGPDPRKAEIHTGADGLHLLYELMDAERPQP
jgi:hypothetical protein